MSDKEKAGVQGVFRFLQNRWEMTEVILRLVVHDNIKATGVEKGKMISAQIVLILPPKEKK